MITMIMIIIIIEIIVMITRAYNFPHLVINHQIIASNDIIIILLQSTSQLNLCMVEMFVKFLLQSRSKVSQVWQPQL